MELALKWAPYRRQRSDPGTRLFHPCVSHWRTNKHNTHAQNVQRYYWNVKNINVIVKQTDRQTDVWIIELIRVTDAKSDDHSWSRAEILIHIV